MNYIKISNYDIANGKGIRTTLWTSGCSHRCNGCHNPNTWDPNSGTLFTINTINEIIESLSPSYIRGVTLSGGDPLYPDNRSMIEMLCKRIRDVYKDTKDIWMWTGYLYEDVKDLPLMKYIDVLVDGPFILEERDITHPYHGSSNQRVIDVNKSRELGKIVLYSE